MSVVRQMPTIAKTATVPMKQIASSETRHTIKQINKMLTIGRIELNKFWIVLRAECGDLVNAVWSLKQAGSAESLVNTIALLRERESRESFAFGLRVDWARIALSLERFDLSVLKLSSSTRCNACWTLSSQISIVTRTDLSYELA